ncbi:PTS transporter subunit EIIC [Bacillaceae bacterium SIJ1]|uniref:glucose PTS transporter subunit IIA n=1 Tax=Litoribacterium kuwaitense TaxID=1398745 RepID=UPI0013EC36B6|nr:glucose PTS transporter subunit IIA [Litoribacterium kuwaitense]NGP45881.1 PTS transporter subunit EIIC [Litoribacterium kuwaitense]
MLSFLQRLGKALMLPIAVLPAAGILIGIGLIMEEFLVPGGSFIRMSGQSIVDNLALIFSAGVAIGFAKDSNGTAALAGVIGYFILSSGLVVIGGEDISMGVLGGLISGVSAGLLYNRFNNIQLPEFLAFFGGRRFVPIIQAGVMIVLTAILGFVWPPIQGLVEAGGQSIVEAGAVGAGLFGFINRLLIPLGLHHVINTLVWFQFGEYEGATGDLSRFLAGDPEAGIFMGGFYVIMMFGIPGAAVAIGLAAKKGRRKATLTAMLSLAFASFFTGITEPVEYSFMFLAPVLYGIHALLTGSALYLATIFGVRHGFGFSAGAIDFVLQSLNGTRIYILLIMGVIYFFIYLGIFYFVIKKFDLKTPGREDEDEELAVTGSPGTVDMQANKQGFDKHQQQAAYFLEDLGGKDNLNTIDHCATRLRLTVHNMDRVDEAALKKHGARGTVKVNKTNLQIIVGTQVEFVYNALHAFKEGILTTQRTNEQLNDAPQSAQTNDQSFANENDIAAVTAPLTGTLIRLEDVKDEAFSKKMMGDGFAINPTDGTVTAPFHASVAILADTRHAIGLKTKSGTEILIHVGLDTVQLKGEGFEALVAQGDDVEEGQPLLRIDLDALANKANLTTPVIFTNLPEHINIDLLHQGEVTARQKGIVEAQRRST